MMSPKSLERWVLRCLYALCFGAGLLSAGCSDDGEMTERGILPPLAGGMAIQPPITCAAGLTGCNGACMDLRANPMNCGQCGVSCGTGTCTNGQCACPSTLTTCPTGCIDVLNDDANCGACGRKCAAGTERCQQGQCLPLAAVCNPPCAAGQICTNGMCKCPELTTLCAGACLDTQTTPAHCGMCNNACMPGQLCQGGACVCPPGQTLCNGQCADVQISGQHCGMCGKACAMNETCMAGICRAPAGADGCSGAAVNVPISEVAVYQTVKVPVSKGATPIEPMMRATDLIQDRPTMFRVSVTPGMGFSPRELSARVTIKNGAGEDQYFSKQMVSKASTDADTASTFQVLVPREKVLADTRYSVELVECAGAGATGMSMNARVPAMGDAPLGAVSTGVLKIHIIPLVSNGKMPDTSAAGLMRYKEYIEAIYPIKKVEFEVGMPMNVAYPVNWNSTIEQLRSRRQADRPTAEKYYYGLIKPTETFREFCSRGCTAGVGFIGSPTQAQTRVAMGLGYADAEFSSVTMAHEVGHNHGRPHAPCAPGGQIQGVDRMYPHMGGKTGVWGWDSRKNTFVDPGKATDLMGYCDPKWISDYTYKLISDRGETVNARMFEVPNPALLQQWQVLLVDKDGPQWSNAFPEPDMPYGTAEDADVLDIDGNPIERVTVYRTQIGDSDGASILVPEPKQGWHAIKVFDAIPHAFSAPVTIPEPY